MLLTVTATDSKGASTKTSLNVAITSTSSSFTLGTTRPTWDNRGCTTPVSGLTRRDEREVILNQPGQILENVWLPNGRVTRAAPGTIIRNCVINPGPGGSDRRPIHGNCGITSDPAFDTTGGYIDSVSTEPGYAAAATTDYDITGMYVVGTTVTNCAIRGYTDSLNVDVNVGLGIFTPSVVEGVYGLQRWLPYPYATTKDGTHSDGVQIAGGSGHRVRGCHLEGPAVTRTNGKVGQGVVLTPYHSAIDDVTITDNWFVGSLTQVSAWVPSTYYGGPQSQRITIDRNRHEGECTWHVLVTPEVYAARKSITGNVVGPAGTTFNNGTLAAGRPANINIASAG